MLSFFTSFFHLILFIFIVFFIFFSVNFGASILSINYQFVRNIIFQLNWILEEFYKRKTAGNNVRYVIHLVFRYRVKNFPFL
jgi:hypothetical protein